MVHRAHDLETRLTCAGIGKGRWKEQDVSVERRADVAGVQRTSRVVRKGRQQGQAMWRPTGHQGL